MENLLWSHLWHVSQLRDLALRSHLSWKPCQRSPVTCQSCQIVLVIRAQVTRILHTSHYVKIKLCTIKNVVVVVPFFRLMSFANPKPSPKEVSASMVSWLKMSRGLKKFLFFFIETPGM